MRETFDIQGAKRRERRDDRFNSEIRAATKVIGAALMRRWN